MTSKTRRGCSRASQPCDQRSHGRRAVPRTRGIRVGKQRESLCQQTMCNGLVGTPKQPLSDMTRKERFRYPPSPQWLLRQETPGTRGGGRPKQRCISISSLNDGPQFCSVFRTLGGKPTKPAVRLSQTHNTAYLTLRRIRSDPGVSGVRVRAPRAVRSSRTHVAIELRGVEVKHFGSQQDKHMREAITSHSAAGTPDGGDVANEVENQVGASVFRPTRQASWLPRLHQEGRSTSAHTLALP